MELKDFLNIAFNSTQEQSKQLMLQRPGCILDGPNCDSETLVFTGVKFGGRDTTFIMLSFFEDKFCKATVIISPKLEAYAISLYNEIKNEINKRYFVTDLDYEQYKSPYEKNDGYTETAIATGNASFACYWKFGNANGIDDYISIAINESLNVVVAYENGELTGQLVEKRKQNDLLDY